MKQEASVTVRPHYVRDIRNRPVITLMVARLDAEKFAVGIAYCSERDMPSKQAGKFIASKRLVGAINANKNGLGKVVTYGQTPDGSLIVKNYLGDTAGIDEVFINHRFGGALLKKLSDIFKSINKKCC